MKTKIIIISITVVAIVADIVLIACGDSSISQTIQTLSGKFPIIPFAVGVLCGHLFWRVGGLKDGKR
jgi:integral membrane sensor domain MASE1